MALTSLGYLQQPPDALHLLLPPSLSPFEAVLPSDQNATEKLEEDRFIGYLFRAFGFIERSLPISPYLLTAPFNGFNLYASSTCAADDNGRPCVRARASIHDGISSPSMKGSRVGWMIVAPPPSPPSDRHASKYQSIAIRAGLGSISKNGEENNNKDDRRNGIPSSSVEQAQFIASLHGDYTYVARERFRYYDSLPISCIHLSACVCYSVPYAT